MRTTRKTAALLFIFLLVVSNAYAFDNGPLMKLTRGVSNIVTSPLEYFVQFNELKKRHEEPATQFFGGLLYGTAFMGARIITGALEVLTFPFPVPANYESIMDPPTAWDYFQTLK